jgi:hypothetical protein
VERWLGWDEADRDALFALAVGLKIGENHIRDLLDWLEEIAVRDSAQIREVLARPGVTDAATDPRLGRSDKLKRIKEYLRRLRFPRLARIEDAIYERIHRLKLGPAIRLSVPPGLEGGDLRIELNTSSAVELKKLALRLAQAADGESVREIFAMLSGDAPDKESGSGS